jgi:Asp-tRNA(Asn)/Glu-tRNA(Gln) amidotransferase A subunit family amidase
MQIFNAIWTVLHVPVINVPGFVGETGMPVGLSLVTGRFRDRHLLKVAREVGAVFEKEGGFHSNIL